MFHTFDFAVPCTVGVNADILPDKETGMFTLVFTDKKQQKYAGTAARFQQYCTQPRIGPVISRGEAPLEASNYTLHMLMQCCFYPHCHLKIVAQCSSISLKTGEAGIQDQGGGNLGS